MKMTMSQTSEPVNTLFHGKGELRSQMELRLLIRCPYNRKINLDDPGGSNVITAFLKIEEAGRGVSQSDVM